MKLIRKLKGAKNAEVNLVEIDGRFWVHKKEDAVSSINEKSFYRKLEENGLPSLKFLENQNLPSDEILVEYVKDSPTLSDTEEDYLLWGRLLRRLHDISYEKPTKLLLSSLDEIDLESEYKRELNIARKRMSALNDFTDSEVDTVVARLESGLKHLELNYSLVHGDMHSANVLKRNGDLLLFDKSSDQWSFTPMIDLAIVMLGIPNGFLVDSEGDEYVNDTVLRESFFSGYGEIDLDELKLFSQLEASRRINNSHEPLNPQIVKLMIK